MNYVKFIVTINVSGYNINTDIAMLLIITINFINNVIISSSVTLFLVYFILNSFQTHMKLSVRREIPCIITQ